MPSLSSSCSPWLMGWNAVALTSLQSLLLILSDWNNQYQLCLKVPGMASKNEMLPHLAVEARCSPSLAIFVGHLPALAKFAIVPLLSADELAFVFQSECIWKPALSSRPSLAMKRMQSRGAWSLLLSADKAQLDSMMGSRDILKCVVNVFSSLCFWSSHRAWDQLLEALEVDYGAMCCCSVKGYSIIYLHYIILL